MSDNMEDQASSSSPSNVIKGGLSAAELRERRRQKILTNQTSRLEMITGGGGSTNGVKAVQTANPMQGGGDPPSDVLDWIKLSSRPGESIEEETVENGVTIIRRRVTTTSGTERSSTTSTTSTTNEDDIAKKDMTFTTSKSTTTIKSSIITNKARTSTGSSATKKSVSWDPNAPSVSEAAPTAVGFMMTQPDGSTIHPKLSSTTCRILVCLLGIFLALFNAKFFLITFCSWEVAVFVINGFPNDDPTPNNLILLIALMGLKEVHLARLKFVLKLCNTILTDLSILIVSSLMSRVLFENYMGILK